MKKMASTVLLTAALYGVGAHADINIGVTLSTTGPAASLGIPEKNTIALLPKSAGGQKINYIVLDDASDTTAAVTNTRKLITESRVDAIIGSTTTPGSLAMTDVVAENQVPTISLGGSTIIAEPVDAKRKWVFKMPQNEKIMATAIVDNMAAAGIKTVGFIAFSDSYGESWLKEFTEIAHARKIKVVSSERFARTDTSVTGQVLKLLASRPDAVFIAASGTPAALPAKGLRERGYTGTMYQTHGVSNADFIRVGGRDVEGTILPVGPVLVADQLPDSNPVKKTAMAYVALYEAAYGKGSISTFGAHAWDAGNLIANAIPAALKVAQPGTPEFRNALRNSIENTRELAGAHGIFNMSPTDHVGLDQRGSVMVKIESGKWKWIP